MSNKVTFVVPEAPVPASPALAAQRKIEKRGIRLGILDNSKGTRWKMSRNAPPRQPRK
jgi:hypothetical protein